MQKRPPVIWTRTSAKELADHTPLRNEWDQLNQSRLDLPFMTADAVVAALQVLGSGNEQLLVARCAERAVAMTLLVREDWLRWRTFQPSQLPLGAWVADSEWALADLARSLLHSGVLGPVLALSVTQVDPLQDARPADAPDARCTDYIDTAWVDIEGSFEDYWAARGKNLRQNLRKQRNKLAAEGIATTMRVLSDPADIAPTLQRYGALESAGWKADEGTAIAADNEQGHFYFRLFDEAAKRGEARLFEYLFDGQTAAVNLALLRQGTLVVLKTTYDESLPKAFSPAFLLREEELQRWFSTNSEVRRVEYYGRLMDWHTKLTLNQRTIYHLTVFRSPFFKRWVDRLKRMVAALRSRSTTT